MPQRSTASGPARRALPQTAAPPRRRTKAAANGAAPRSQDTADGARRRKGRPQGPRAAVGREALIKATRELLRTKAPRDLSRQDVARFAGVDPALVRYYFGDRNGLLTAAAAQISREMHERMAKAASEGSTTQEKLEKRTHAFLGVHAEYPHLNELIIQQILYGTEEAAKRARRDMVSDSVARLSFLIDEGVARGELRAVDPRLLHIALIGMYDFFFTGRPVIEQIFGKRVSKPELTRLYGDFINDMLMNGIKAKGAKPKRPAPARKKSAKKTT